MLVELKNQKPIVHSITNHVVSNFQANGLLAIGASPIMGEAPEEAAELASLAGALSLNIGTLNAVSLQSMLIAGKAANEKNIPVVLDPVGAGATPYRADAVTKILSELKITVLRCNAGELAAIAGADWQAKGVDAGEGRADVGELARQLAVKLGIIVAVTGEVDIVTDGEQFVEIPFGDAIMASITGTGCLLSAAVAAFLAVNPKDAFMATAAAMQFYAIAGERAAAYAKLPGTFQLAFLDELSSLQQNEIEEIIKGKEEKV
ncbi:hydroxyethylthiazole kinase [Planomicrobium sp. CPCC 101110]|uniref:hydroxyethylthiazole kinase n=1 Tax=Planomicrobium sp. CPCC 101110 TaxID=2599619 RepID=UPI0011B72E32|nr:hydroxyethylthiazole kinase [Planomicrobium sp. CPCC 101110]TWT27366.1 hydroxyethylthiazole kinase [Planomicrobium sp. CPCC 101110]